jgi:predicted LPLAT superfamily acyltransferase
MRRDPEGDLKEPGRPEWAARPERGRPLAIRLGVWLALTFGRAAARVWLHALTLYYLAVSPADRAASRQFLRRALDREPGAADVYRHFHTFATTILDRIYLLNGQYGRFDVRVHGREIVDAELARGQGCLLIGAHIGSFEIIRFVGRDAGVLRVALAMYEENAGALAAMLHAINPHLAMRVIALGKPDSMLRLDQALTDGESVGMLADRTLAGDSMVSLPFLGAQARFATGPFRFAAALRRPMVLMLGLYRGGARYDVHFEELAGRGWTESGERGRAAQETVERYVARLEHYCRQAPYNWFNFYDFWRQ